MVIARFFIGDRWMTHGGILIEGAVEAAKYGTEGWFPISNFKFGVREPGSKTGDKKTDPATTPTSTTATKPAAKAPADKKKADSDREGSTMTISKSVDKATTDLMWLAMSHRTKEAAKGKEDKVECDIHVLSSMELRDPTSKEIVANIYPILMLHLEGVLVTDWNISSGGESRGSEDITFSFDKAAIRYISTPDGKVIDPGLDTGWDQTKNEMWPNANSDWHLTKFDRYTPKLF